MTAETAEAGCYFCTYHYGFLSDARSPEHRQEASDG